MMKTREGKGEAALGRFGGISKRQRCGGKELRGVEKPADKILLSPKTAQISYGLGERKKGKTKGKSVFRGGSCRRLRDRGIVRKTWGKKVEKPTWSRYSWS